MPYSPIRVRVRNFVRNLWSGNFGLARTYWYYGVVINHGFWLLIFLSQGLFGDLVALPFVLINLAYSVIWSVGTWRAAGRYSGSKVLSAVAKMIVALGWLYLIQSFLDELQ